MTCGRRTRPPTPHSWMSWPTTSSLMVTICDTRFGLIAQSDAYARSSDAVAGNQHDDRFYSHFLRKPLPAGGSG